MKDFQNIFLRVAPQWQHVDEPQAGFKTATKKGKKRIPPESGIEPQRIRKVLPLRSFRGVVSLRETFLLHRIHYERTNPYKVPTMVR